MRRLITAVLVMSALALMGGRASAQSAIAGVVKDATGGALPGVTVEAASPALIEKTRSASPTAMANTRSWICTC